MNELMERLRAAETVDEINAVLAAIEEKKAQEAAFASKAAILEQLKGREQNIHKIEQVRTLGDFALKNLNLDAMRAGSAKSAGTDYGYKAYTSAQTSEAIIQYDQDVVDRYSARKLAIRNLFGAESISGNSLKYFILGAKEEQSSGSAPASTNENASKPQFHIPVTSATATLGKIAGWYYETDELIEDNAFLKSSLDARGLFELDSAIEAYLMTTLLGTSGVGSLTYAKNGSVSADNVFAAIMKVIGDSNYDADAIVINPTDYQALRLAKDSNNQYYGGGVFYGPYGQGGVAQQPGLWGLNTVVTKSISAGTVLVGAFKQGASVITKAGDGARVEVVTGDHDDRVANRVTVIVEERLALATRVPAAFVKITEAAA